MPNSYKPFRQAPKTRQVAAIGTLLTTLLWHGAVSAQQPMPEATGASTRFAISGFELTGDNPLSPQESDRVLQPFVGPQASLLTLQKAAAALESALKARGFALHRVSLPPQQVGAKVTLHVVKFGIGKVTVDGQSHFSEANIRASLPELREGEAPNFTRLAIQTAIANENPSKQVQVSLKESDEADKIDARVLVRDSRPWRFSASLANTGSDATGQDRLSLVGSHANVFGLDHEFSGAYTTSLERIKDVKQLGLNYRVPLYRQGGVIGLSYTSSDVVGSFGTFNSTGAGQTLGITYSHYLPPAGGRRSFLSLSLDEKLFNAIEINGAPVIGQLDRRSRPLTVGYTARTESDTALWGYNAELAFNMAGGASNDLAAYQSEDARIQTVNWKAVRGDANYVSSFAAGWLWSVRGQFQYSPDALISGEQFGLGGASSVRGTGERAIAGDSGLFSSLELTTPYLVPGLRALGFVDAGWLSNHQPDVNPNKPDTDHLLSAGLGLRYASGDFAVSLDWGRVLTGSVLPLSAGSSLPQAGDQKLHLSFTARF